MKRTAIPLTESVSLAMRYWRRSLLVVAALTAIASLALVLASPWDNPGRAGAQPGEFFITHSAKFVCGTAVSGDPVVPGDYQTAINVHNFTANTVGFDKKAVQALPEGVLPQPPPSQWEPASLGPDYAFEIDCAEIAQWLWPGGGAPTFYKGFVVISESAPETSLDVVGVYTGTDVAPPGEVGIGQTIDIERVEGELHEWFQPPPDPAAYYQYSAKFVCGTAGPGDPVVPGDYLTAINVHNPWEDPADYIDLYKKAVWAQEETITPEPPSPWELYQIEANRAFEIDCNEIGWWLFGDPQVVQWPPFYKGFVVISSPNELDVVAVYTAERIEIEGKGFALDIEAVPYSIQPEPVITEPPLDVCCQWDGPPETCAEPVPEDDCIASGGTPFLGAVCDLSGLCI